MTARLRAHLMFAAPLLALVACGGDRKPDDHPGDTDRTGDPAGTGTGAGTGSGTGGTTATGTGGGAGTGTGTGATALAFLDGPAVSPNPNPLSPLVWVLAATTSEPTSAEVTITDPERVRTITFPGERPTHDLDLLDLATGVENTVVLTVTTAGGERLESDPLTFVPPAIDLSDQLRIERVDPARMEPGLTLVRVGRKLAAITPEGETRWIYGPYPAPDLGPMVAQRTPRGTFRVLFTSYTGRGVENIAEIDARGNILRRYAPAEHAGNGDIPVDAVAFHHDVQPLPGDDLVFPSVEVRLVTGYPGSETDPEAREDAMVVGDVITEIDPAGGVLATYHLLDLLDPHRIGYDSVSKKSIWDDVFGMETRDWSHVNSVVYDPVTDGFVVSVRHQDAVIHLDRTSGEVTWILGPHANWGPRHAALLLEPVGDVDYPNYHQHAANLTDTGTLLLMDNGNRRASPWTPPLPPDEVTSRAVEVRVDPVAMTVERVWAYEPGWFSSSQGDAAWQPATGNVLTVFGNIVPAEDGVHARAVEVTRTTPPEVVWELALTNGDQLYRVERTPTLYPDDVQVR